MSDDCLPSDVVCMVMVMLTSEGDVYTLPYSANPSGYEWFAQYIIKAIRQAPLPDQEAIRGFVKSIKGSES